MDNSSPELDAKFMGLEIEALDLDSKLVDLNSMLMGMGNGKLMGMANGQHKPINFIILAMCFILEWKMEKIIC